ncbi:N-acetyltransferase family protein [Actinomadura nitritigenes]|uniref:GNAT family N-acetyltransferase n=1 Tax=Actinomadura nitritigenes TaxID=134602 RepID=UPI003D92C444
MPGVRASHHGRGIGRGLLDAAIAEVRRRCMWRLELSTMTHNHVAWQLYAACGFEVEGLRRSSSRVDGEPVDEYYMAMLLPREDSVQ